MSSTTAVLCWCRRAGYVVLGNNDDSATNGGAPVDYSYGSGWFLSNGADEVILLDDLLFEVDRVEYDGGPTFPDPTGASMALIDPALDNNWVRTGVPPRVPLATAIWGLLAEPTIV